MNTNSITPDPQAAQPYADLTWPEDQPKPTSNDPAAPYGRHINWGQVVKGAVIVTAVLLVGVVAMSVATPLLISGFSSVATTPVIGPIIAGIANGGAWAAGFLVHSVATLGGMAWSGLVGLFAGAPVLAAPAIHTAGVTTGAIVGGGAVVASLPLAHKAVASVHVLDPNMAPATTPNGMEDGGASVLMAKKASSTGVTTQDNGAVEAHSATTTAKISHHAGEDDNHHGAAWLRRVTNSSAFKQTLAEGGSYQQAIMASQAGNAGLQARNNSYSEQLNAERTAIEASLKDSSRA